MVQNIGCTYDNEICCEFDTTDFENESDDQKEFDESEKINQIVDFVYCFFQSNKIVNSTSIVDNYQTKSPEFSTPPPEFI